MSQKTSLISEPEKTGGFVRKISHHRNLTNLIPTHPTKNIEIKIPNAEHSSFIEKTRSLDCLSGNFPVSRKASSLNYERDLLPFHLPTLIKTREMAARQQTFNIFFNKHNFESESSKPKWDFHVVKREASLEQINQLSKVARKRSYNKPKSGVMYINELWDDRHYKKTIKTSGIQSYKDQLGKISRAPLQERKNIFTENFSRKLAADELSRYPQVEVDVLLNVSIEDSQCEAFVKSRRSSIEYGIENAVLSKKFQDKVSTWSESNNTSVCIPDYQNCSHSNVEVDRGGVLSSTSNESHLPKAVK